jgi:nitrite reductase/ring-hydroxylating ferredoxin subunit
LNNNKTYTWHKIAESVKELAFSTTGLCEIEVANKKICIAKVDEQIIKACAAKCPHASGEMAKGFIDALGNIVCPLHRYKFSLANGRNTSGEGYYLKTYAIEIKKEGVFVGFEKTKLF